MATQPPSPKQLNYLKALAARTGQTFTWPKTEPAGEHRDRPPEAGAPVNPSRADDRADR